MVPEPMAFDIIPHMKLALGAFCAAAYGLVSKKFDYSADIIIFFIALTFTISALVILYLNNCSITKMLSNIWSVQYLVSGISYFSALFAFTLSHKILPMSIIGPFLGTLPMFYSFWEYIFNNNIINFKQGISYLIAAVGVVIINFNALKRDIMEIFTKQKMNKYWLGILSIIFYCLAISFFILYNTSLGKTLPREFDFTFQRLFGTGLYGLLGTTLLLFVKKLGRNMDYAWPSINNMVKLCISVICTAFLANYLFLVSKPDINPVVYAGMFNLRPLFVIMLGMLVLKEKVDRNMLIGMLIVAIGMGLSIYYSETLVNVV